MSGFIQCIDCRIVNNIPFNSPQTQAPPASSSADQIKLVRMEREVAAKTAEINGLSMSVFRLSIVSHKRTMDQCDNSSHLGHYQNRKNHVD